MSEIRVLQQTAHWVAVDKDAGLSVHNNEDSRNLLLVLEKQLRVPKLFPVHRLDKETSGVQILALNETAARSLAEEFQDRSVKKLYTGILRGQLPQPEGRWNQALSDKAEGRKNPAGLSKDRVPCETRYRTLQTNKYFALCEFDLITGRQHQIRKHTALVNHHLVGDPRYGDPGYNKKMAGFYKTDRMFLHCTRVEIAGVKLEAPLSADFGKLFEA